MTSAVVILWTLLIIAPPWIIVHLARRVLLLRLEERVLWQKYGDLPMFRHFFERERIRPSSPRHFQRNQHP